MRDITHYFADLPKNSENTSVSLKEVRLERAKIQASEDMAMMNEVSRTKRKRGKVKLKISEKSDEGTICNILDNSTDLLYKMSSSYPNPKRRLIDYSPKEKTILKSGLTFNNEDYKLQTNDQSKNIHLRAKSQSIKLSPNSDITLKETQSNDTDKGIDRINSSYKQNMRVEEKCPEKLGELANLKGYSTTKIIEDEIIEVQKQLENRKKMYTLQSNKSPEIILSDENCPKNDYIKNTKQTSNLLNYFSKAIPEQLENERLMKARVTIKAEVHSSQNSSETTVFSSTRIQNIPRKEAKSNKKLSHTKYDEICLLQSETLTLLPKTDELKSPLRNKPKWSLKIQLQTNTNFQTPGILNKGDPSTSIASLKSLKEDFDGIPKVLLPMKNRKVISKSSLLNGHTPKNKRQEKLKNGINENSNTFPILKQKQTNMNPQNIITDNECSAIESDSLKRRSKDKLAPLFTKKVKLNPDTTAARRLFLHSDIQENDECNKNPNQAPVESATLPFPKISHITQISLANTISNQKYQLKFKTVDQFLPLLNLTYFKTIPKLINDTNTSESSYKCVESDIEQTLQEIQSICSGAQFLWNSISQLQKFETFNQTSKTTRKSNRSNLKQSYEISQNEVFNSPWTDKYKPNSAEEIVGNEDAAMKLRSWLDSWKSLKSNDDYSSSEEFYTSDCSMSSNVEHNQVAVLIGPHGSGKTASVYAIAQELGYKVLEVNASSKRPGKKILKDFEEATKSHRVKKSNLKDAFTTVLKKLNERNTPQNSLILMEDVDLVFEEDEGFISATFQLAAHTKRPIIMTLRDTCSHLSKMASRQFRIDFQPVAGKRVSALLQLIALAEKNCKLPQSCIYALCESGDLRRALLHLQYLLLSGKDNVLLQSLTNDTLTWKEILTHVYKPAIKTEKKDKRNNRKINSNILNNLAYGLDNFAIMSSLVNIEDPTEHQLCLNNEPNMSFIENSSLYSSLERTNSEISNWFSDVVKALFSNNFKNLNNQVNKSYYKLLIRKKINFGINSALSQIASYTLDRQALAIDYLSSIRTICRAEEIRNDLNSKRGNRFFHYLQNYKFSSVSAKSDNILSAACKMLEEKLPTSSET